MEQVFVTKMCLFPKNADQGSEVAGLCLTQVICWGYGKPAERHSRSPFLPHGFIFSVQSQLNGLGEGLLTLIHL